jgi:hypothetical protein
MRNWRYITGSFAVSIPVTAAKVMLPLEGKHPCHNEVAAGADVAAEPLDSGFEALHRPS